MIPLEWTVENPTGKRYSWIGSVKCECRDGAGYLRGGMLSRYEATNVIVSHVRARHPGYFIDVD